MKPQRGQEASAAAQQAWREPLLLNILEVKDHSDTVVARAHGIDDRNASESLRGGRIFVSKSRHRL
jgi:16S rRNA processing protein RimM